ncbi:MAG: GTP pyrophosphokinase family protein [Clostridia bacterium]|nr:GTP pyrophosphokinase family protein [Clostridia bacterium]
MKEEIAVELLDELLPADPEERTKALEDLDVLLMRYESAIREIRTKFEILNDELSLSGHQNPIASISSRRKTLSGILEKLKRQGFPLTLESIEENLTDVAGIRIICSFMDDIYKVAKMLQQQDDITVLLVKDYIAKPKPNGYRSYHMIVEVPVFFSNEKKSMKVEVQIRTIAMDFWANLEHRMRYKKDIEAADEIIDELKECADNIAATDTKMMIIREKIRAIKPN